MTQSDEIDYKNLYYLEKQKRQLLKAKILTLESKLKTILYCEKQKNEIFQNQFIQCSDDYTFWGILTSDKDRLLEFKEVVEYILNEFGTSLPCNRFDVGNSIEFCITNLIKNTGLNVQELPNAKRFDLSIEGYKHLSIKYSSCGDITLHNSNNCINKDLEMRDTILLTPNRLYLITMSELEKQGLNVNNYIKNNGDSLKLKRSLLRVLETVQYPYMHDISINHDKSTCKNRLCSKLFFEQVMKEFHILHK